MSLSMDEQRALEAIEHHLCGDDPRLASVFHRFAAASRRRSAVARTPTGAPVRVTSTVSYPPQPAAPASRLDMLRRALPWVVLALGAGVLLAGIALPELWLALLGAVTVAATPLLVPIGTGAARAGRQRARQTVRG